MHTLSKDFANLNQVYDRQNPTDTTDILLSIAGLAKGGVMASETTANVKHSETAMQAIFEQILLQSYEAMDRVEISEGEARKASAEQNKVEAASHNTPLLDDAQDAATKSQELAMLALEGLYLGTVSGGVEIALEHIIERLKGLSIALDSVNRDKLFEGPKGGAKA